MAVTDLPIAIWSGSFTLGGIELRCHVLSDGQRIIEADSIARLFDAMGRPDFGWAEDEIDAFARWRRGR